MYFSASFFNSMYSIVEHKEDRLIVATLSNVHIRIKTMAFISVWKSALKCTSTYPPAGCAVRSCSNPQKGKILFISP